MESLAIMRLPSHESTPVVAVRVVSDGEERGAPFDFECALDSLGRLQLWRLFPQAPVRPGVVQDLIRIGPTRCGQRSLWLAPAVILSNHSFPDLAYGSSRRQE
jgi:hypothetical protein